MVELSDKIQSYVKSLFGEESLAKFIESINVTPSQFIRINSLKTTTEKTGNVLYEKYRIKTEQVHGLQNTLKVTEGSELTGKTLEHILGHYYVQSLSSMLPPIVLAPDKNDIVLDLCAAPGSKTTQLAELMHNDGTLIANEIQLSRLKALVHNIERMNIANVGVVHQKGELLSKAYGNYFDKILVDAPCSGLGIIQKKDEVTKWWDEKKVNILADLQLKLLIAAIKILREGGEIVYSTCTLTTEENELIIDKVLSKYPVELMDVKLPVVSHNGITTIKGEKLNSDIEKGKRIFPWETETDGFFIAKLKKTGETKSPEKISFETKNVKFQYADNKDIFKKIKSVSDYFGIEFEIVSNYKYIIKGHDISFVAKRWIDENPGMFDRIGLKFGTIDKNGEIVLNTQAAQLLQKEIKKNIIELKSRDELKIYMKGGIIKADSLKEGQYVVKFENYILGTAVVTKTGIKSRFPRSKRMQEIYLD